MDWKKSASKHAAWMAAVGTVAVMFLLTLPFMPSLAKNFRFIFFSKNKRTTGVLDEIMATYRAGYQQAFQDVQERIAELRKLEVENMKLRLREAQLKTELETAQFECRSIKSEKISEEIRARLEEKTGSRTGRLPAGIPYRVPAQLPPSELYTLGVSFLRAGENEKAALIMDYLTRSEEKNSYQRPQDFLTAGVAWYRIQNYKEADAAFERSLSVEANEDELQHQGQARLWRALVARKLKHSDQEQFWMRQVLDHHPHSVESSWINPLDDTHRKPAGDTHGGDAHEGH